MDDRSATGASGRAEAVEDALRTATWAEAELDPLRAPRIHRWAGSAASAAHDALDDVDDALRSARQAVHEFRRAARAASHG